MGKQLPVVQSDVALDVNKMIEAFQEETLSIEDLRSHVEKKCKCDDDCSRCK